eukprot:UN25966
MGSVYNGLFKPFDKVFEKHKITGEHLTKLTVEELIRKYHMPQEKARNLVSIVKKLTTKTLTDHDEYEIQNILAEFSAADIAKIDKDTKDFDEGKIEDLHQFMTFKIFQSYFPQLATDICVKIFSVLEQSGCGLVSLSDVKRFLQVVKKINVVEHNILIDITDECDYLQIFQQHHNTKKIPSPVKKHKQHHRKMKCQPLNILNGYN